MRETPRRAERKRVTDRPNPGGGLGTVAPMSDRPPTHCQVRPHARTLLLCLLLCPVLIGAPASAQMTGAQTSSDQTNGAPTTSEPATSEPTTSDAGSVPALGALWQQSRDGAAVLWDRSTGVADAWWQRTREATLGAWEQARAELTPAEADAFGEVWTGVVPQLERTLTLVDEQQTLPARAWFSRDQRDAEVDINALLEAAVGVLSISPVQQYRGRIADLQTEITRARADLDGYRRERVAAPAESRLRRTVADYDRLIDGRQADIRRYQQELERIKREFAGELRAMGLELEPDQVELLLATVVGDNIIDLGIVFDNVKAITGQLERLVRESGEDLQSARRYYGMYVILLRALEQMHREVETVIAEQYIPRIEDIGQRAARLADETAALLLEQPEQRAVLTANREAQQLTIAAARVYRDYLIEQQRQVAAAREALRADIDTAWNTYETVSVSGDLVDLVQSSERLLNGLLDRQVPALRPFQNLAMKREFERLTLQLRQGGE